MDDGPRLTDGVVTLRPPDERDLRSIQAGIDDPDVIHWIGPPWGTAEATLAINRERWALSPTFAICELGDVCIGHVWANRHADEPAAAAIGYWLLPAVRGRGLATRAVRLISDWLVTERGVAVLRIFTDPANTASQRVAERSGFTRIGVERGRDGADRVRFERRPNIEPSIAIPL